MRKHSRRIKTQRHGGSRKLRGGNFIRRAGQFLGFGRSPADAQPQSDNEQEDAVIQNHTANAETKRVEAENLRRQCQDYQARADALDQQVQDHLNSAAVIEETRALKTRCDEEHAGRLQQIEQDHQRQIEQIQQEHNARLEAANQEQNRRLDAANQASRNELQNCLAQHANTQAVSQARANLADARAHIDAGQDPLSGLVPQQEQLERRGGGRRSRRRGRKSRRGGTGCGTHKTKKMYAGRKSRRGGRKCSPKLGKKCPYYKKYGQHM